MEKIKLAYFGSPDFAADFLEELMTDTSMYRYIEVKLVVTQPDQKVGRKQILTPTPVKIIAEKYKKSEDTKFFAVYCFPSKNFGIELKNIDLALVYAFGDLIPKELLSLPKYGFWNIHPSLLPKYRGPSPIAAPLINGDKITGVTIIKMDEEIDHGPIIAQESLTIDQDDKRPDLEKKLTDLAFEMIKKIIKTGVEGLGIPTARSRGILSEASTDGKRHETGPVFRLIEQNHKEATYTKKLSKQDGFIEFNKLKKLFHLTTSHQSLVTLSNLFRGLFPWPGIWKTIKPIQPGRLDEAKRLKITDLEFVNKKLIIKKVQLEGKNEVDFETFNKAYKIF